MIKIMLPWFFTLSRLVITPFAICALRSKNFALTGYLIVYAIISDFLDGFFARKLNGITTLGALLDAVCDKVFINVVCISFCIYIKPEQISLKILLAIWIIRDIVLTTLSIISTKPFVSQFSGKVYTALQFLFILIVVIHTAFSCTSVQQHLAGARFNLKTDLDIIVWPLCIVFAILGLISARQYYMLMR